MLLLPAPRCHKSITVILHAGSACTPGQVCADWFRHGSGVVSQVDRVAMTLFQQQVGWRTGNRAVQRRLMPERSRLQPQQPAHPSRSGHQRARRPRLKLAQKGRGLTKACRSGAWPARGAGGVALRVDSSLLRTPIPRTLPVRRGSSPSGSAATATRPASCP